MKNKKNYLLLASLSFLFLFTACGKDQSETAFNDYKKAWEAQDYERMYSKLSTDSKARMTEEDFVERYRIIYEAIDAENIQIEALADEESEEDQILFQLSMDTSIAPLEIDDYQMTLVKEEQEEGEDYFVEWDESLIFPQMEEEDKVRVESIRAKRGEIFDQAGEALAINGPRYTIGIHPARFDEDDVSLLAETLDIDASTIQEKLDQNTDPEFFVPVVKVAQEDEELVTNLLAIEGVLSQEVDDRLYPGGEAFGALIGYINPITAEELEENEAGSYSSTSLIGKAGLEKVYEKDLAASDGKELYISKIEDGEEVERISLASKEAADGQDLQLTINSELQKKIYAEVEGDVGTASALDPLTGEILALVSFPSYDPNLYRTYTPNTLRAEWEAMEASPFDNRFNKAYSPGSVFKLVTAGIALENDTIEADEKLPIEGKSWQKDSSWGDYQVNRVSSQISQVDLKDAFIYSDNIYFAQAALAVGAEDYLADAKDFGFEEDLDFDYPFVNSQIVNEETIDSDILLADTGYGQGQVQMSALHLAAIYSSIVNEGSMMQPILVQKEAEIWKENLYSEENRQILLDNLTAVIESPNGTGRAAQIEGIQLAGKTGTAEFKQSQTESGKENGWFVALNVDEPEIVLSMMIEDVEGRGGSQYPLEKVRAVLEDYFKE